jgi:hypothetical protein
VSISVEFAESSHFGGFVYCVVQRSQLAAPTSVSQVLLTAQASARFGPSSQAISGIVVSGLSALTSYTAYVAVVTSYQYSSTLSQVLATASAFTTPCCKTVSFVSVPAYVATTKSYFQFPFAVAVSAVPSSVLSISPKLTDSSGTVYSRTIASISPSPVNISAASTSLTLTFYATVSTVTLSSVYLSTTLTGSSASQYKVTTSSTKIDLRNSSVPLPAPVFTSANFLSSGSSVVFSFSTSTDYAGLSSTTAWTCDSLFNFTNASSSSCVWTNASAVTMTLPQSTSVLVAYNAYVAPYSSAVTVRANKLRAACGGRSSCASNLATPQTTLTLGIVGSTPTTPTVVLTGIGSAIQCENYVIDPSSSYGNAGRQWKRVEWTVVAQSSAFSSQLRNISAVLNASSVYDPITIPSEYLFATTFTFTLTLTNFLGAESSASLSVVMQAYSPSLPVPVHLAFVGSTSVTNKVSSEIVVAANASFPECIDIKSQLSYVWIVTDLSDDTITYEGTSKSANPLQFYLAAYSLEYLHTYSVTISAESLTTVVTTISMTISILEDVVQAIVQNGYTRSWPIDLDLTLDGSASRDYNVAANDTQNLVYTWTCRIVSGATEADYGQDCGSDLFTDPYTSSSLGAYVNSSVITIVANQMIVNGSYLFTLMVVSDTDSTRSDSVTVLVGGLESDSFYLVMNTQVTDGYPFYLSLAGSKLSLQSTIYGSAAVAASWSASFSDAAIELTGLLTQSPQVFSTAQVSNTDGITFPFAIAANILEPGRLYTLTQMACAETGGGTCSTAAIDVYIATAPTGGFLSVSPSSGTELSTSFRLSSNSWIDANTAADGYPLSYSFFYQQLSSAPYLQIRSPASTVYTYTPLPAGVASNDYLITLFGVVANSFAASTNASGLVAVNSSTSLDSLAFLVNATEVLNASLTTFQLTGYSDPVTAVLNSITVSVSAVNCSNALNCTALNRAPCSGVANTCGSCLANFTGVFGPSNVRCVASDLADDSADDALEIGEICSSDGNCRFGYCNLPTSTCQYPNQTCPSNDPLLVCSGHGTCSFVNVANGVALSGDCLISNSLCSAKCACSDGYSEKDCSAAPSYATEVQQMRSNLCSALNSTIRKVNTSAALLDSAVSSLFQSYVTSSTYDADTQAVCSDVLEFVVELAGQGFLSGVKESTFQVLTQFLSTFVVVPAPQVDSNDVMLHAVDSLVGAVQDSLVFGERRLDFVSNNLRLRVLVPLLSDLTTNGSLSAPRSEAEEFYGASVPALTLSSAGLDACSSEFTASYSKLSISQLLAIPYPNRSTSISSLLRYSAASTGVFNSSSASAVDDLTDSYFFMTFPFSFMQDFVLNLTGTSAFADNLTFPDCVQTTGTSTASAATACTGCNVSSYTEHNATVVCRNVDVLCPSYLNSLPARRLSDILTESEESVLSYGVLARAAVDSFYNTITVNPFANLRAAESVLIFLSVLIFVIVGGLVVLFKVDTFEHNRAVYVMAEDRRERLIKKAQAEKLARERVKDIGVLLLGAFGFAPRTGPAESEDEDEDTSDTAAVRSLRNDSFFGRLVASSSSVRGPTTQAPLSAVASPNPDAERKLNAINNDPVQEANSADQTHRGFVKEFLLNVIPPVLLPKQELSDGFNILDELNVWQQLEIIFRFHEYFTFFYPSLNVSRVIRWLALWRGILLALWVDTMFYDVFYASDSQCVRHLDEASCLREPSRVQAGAHMCVWNSATVQVSSSSTEIQNFCSAKDPPNSSVYIIMSSCLILMFVLPIDLCVGYLADEYGRYRPDLSVLQSSWLARYFNWKENDWLGSSPSAVAPTSLVSEMGDIRKFGQQATDADTPRTVVIPVDDDSSAPPTTRTVGSQESAVRSSGFERMEQENEQRLIRTIGRILKRYSPAEWETRRHKKSLSRESPEEFRLRELTYSQLITRRQIGFDDEYLLKAYQAAVTYDSMQPASHEVLLLLARIKKFFLEDLDNLSWSKDPLRTDENREAKIDAIMEQLRVYPSGELIPLTVLQRLRYGTAFARLESMIERRKDNTSNILEQLRELEEQGLGDCMDITLLQHFILEQLPVHKQFALSQYFFDYQRLTPPSINVFAWIGIWAFVFCLYVFLLYWMFAWGVNNGGVTLRAWAINFGLGMLQDIFALKVAKVLVQYVFVFNSARPQLKMIYRVFGHITTLLGTEASRVQRIKLQTTFSVVQYLSASCRVAHSAMARNLVGAAILRLMDDVDVANCRVDRNFAMGLTQYSISGSLGFVYWYQDFVSDQIYELITPLILAAFLLVNAELYYAGSIYLSIPYIVFGGLLFYLYIILRPARQRKLAALRKRQVRAHIHSKHLRGATHGTTVGHSKRFRATRYKTHWQWLTSRAEPMLEAATSWIVTISNPIFQSWKSDGMPSTGAISGTVQCFVDQLWFSYFYLYPVALQSLMQFGKHPRDHLSGSIGCTGRILTCPQLARAICQYLKLIPVTTQWQLHCSLKMSRIWR